MILPSRSREESEEGLLASFVPVEDKAFRRPSARSHELRRNPTEAEVKLWRQQFSARQVAGPRLIRQCTIRPFIFDFISRRAELVIELDGGRHSAEPIKIARKTAFLEEPGYRVINFWNREVLENIDGVVKAIEEILIDSPAPRPSRRREGSRGCSSATDGKS